MTGFGGCRYPVGALLSWVLFGLVACGGGGDSATIPPPATQPPPSSTPPPASTAGISLTAGAAWGPGSLDGVGRSAYFSSGLSGIAAEASGALYVADTDNFTIRKVLADGTVTTLAGRSRVSATQDGKGADGLFSSPGEIAVAADGNVYVLDAGKLRRVTQQGDVTTVATPIDGPGLDKLAAGPDGALYLAGTFNAAIYRLLPGSTFALLAGQPGTQGTADGPGPQARFSEISDLAVDASNSVYVAQRSQHTIRKVAPDGTVTTWAGAAGQMGSLDGAGAAARLSMPGALAVDGQGFLWVAELGSGVFRRISPAGEVTSPFGNSLPLFPAFTTQVRQLAFGASGFLHFTMPWGVARITATGQLSSLAGQNFAEGAAIGKVLRLVVDAAGHPIVTTERPFLGIPENPSLIRKFGPNGELLPEPAYADSFPSDAAGNHYYAVPLGESNGINVTSNVGGFIERIAPTGEATRLVDWPAHSAGAMAPAYLTVAANGALYFIDLITGNLVRWTAAAGSKVLANVGAADASFILFPKNPRSLAVDSDGRVYVLSTTALERVEDGVVVTLAGVKGQPGTSDGAGSQARFTAATAIAADAAGNVYIADQERIRKVTPAGLVTTIAGQVGRIGLRAGSLPGSLGIVTHLAIAPDGALHLISDNALVKVTLQ